LEVKEKKVEVVQVMGKVGETRAVQKRAGNSAGGKPLVKGDGGTALQ